MPHMKKITMKLGKRGNIAGGEIAQEPLIYNFFENKNCKDFCIYLATITSYMDYARILRIPQRDLTSNSADHQHYI